MDENNLRNFHLGSDTLWVMDSTKIHNVVINRSLCLFIPTFTYHYELQPLATQPSIINSNHSISKFKWKVKCWYRQIPFWNGKTLQGGMEASDGTGMENKLACPTNMTCPITCSPRGFVRRE